MTSSGDAAEQVVRLSLEGFEVAAKLTGSAAKEVAILLASVLKQEISQSGKTRGKARLTSMIKSGKELKVFSLPQKDLKKFTEHAKRYGVLYCVLRDRNTNAPDAQIDIIARAEDASKIQRIVDRFELGNRLICYDILDLGKQLMPIGMLVVLDSILNRITQNRAKGKNTYIFIDEIYLLFQHEYSANFLFTLWKRVRKYGAYATGITQNVDDLLQSHTARTMLANSEFIIMLNQASTDRLELAKLLNISDLQMSYITNVEAGHGLIKVGSSLVPFANKFPRNTKLYKLMTTKPGEGV